MKFNTADSTARRQTCDSSIIFVLVVSVDELDVCSFSNHIVSGSFNKLYSKIAVLQWSASNSPYLGSNIAFSS